MSIYGNGYLIDYSLIRTKVPPSDTEDDPNAIDLDDDDDEEEEEGSKGSLLAVRPPRLLVVVVVEGKRDKIKTPTSASGSGQGGEGVPEESSLQEMSVRYCLK